MLQIISTKNRSMEASFQAVKYQISEAVADGKLEAVKYKSEAGRLSVVKSYRN